MSFLAKLTIDDQEYNVLKFSFGVAQKIHNNSARPSSMPIINKLNIVIESHSNTGFFGWSISPYEQKDGEIIFYKRDAMASSRILKFKGAFCINYNDDFDSDSENPMVTTLVLAPETVELDDSTYTNPAVEK